MWLNLAYSYTITNLNKLQQDQNLLQRDLADLKATADQNNSLLQLDAIDKQIQGFEILRDITNNFLTETASFSGKIIEFECY